MTLEKLQVAMDEAARFIEKAVKAKHRIKADQSSSSASDSQLFWVSQEEGAVQQSSMDLSRALSELRE